MNVTGFNPKSAFGSACKLWFDATKLNYANGAAVDNWRDYGSGFLPAAAGAVRGTYTTRVLNNLPGVYFNGSQEMSCTVADPFIGDSKGVVYLVCQSKNLAGHNFHGVISMRDVATGVTCSSIDFCTVYLLADPKPLATNNPNQFDGSQDTIAGSNYVFEYGSTGSAYFMRRNGTAQTLTMLSGANDGKWCSANPAGTDILKLAAIAYTPLPIFFLDGYIFEIIYLGNIVLSTADRSLVRQYLGRKWGIAVAA